MKKAQILCFLSGITLLLSALSLSAYNLHEDRKSGEQAETILEEIKAELPQPPEELPSEKKYDLFSEYQTETETVPEESGLEIDGAVYIGVISVPELNIELPVMRDWSYPNLKLSPCRYQGSCPENNMIIAAHNYRSHFGKIGELHIDSEIIFTDISGKKYYYEVNNIEHIRGTDTEAMKRGSAEDWDLTLFTCTLSGQSRVTVRASRKISETGV